MVTYNLMVVIRILLPLLLLLLLLPPPSYHRHHPFHLVLLNRLPVVFILWTLPQCHF